MKFSKALESTINVIAFAEFENILGNRSLEKGYLRLQELRMEGTRINSILRKDPNCGPIFTGVFACGRLPTCLNYHQFPMLFVCNTDIRDKPEEHWMVIYIEDSSYANTLSPLAVSRVFLLVV